MSSNTPATNPIDSVAPKQIIGWWKDHSTPDGTPLQYLQDIGRPLYILHKQGKFVLVPDQSGQLCSETESDQGTQVIGYIPGCHPSQFGDRSFCLDHQIKFPYVAGAMANGIASCDLVEALTGEGFLSFFGSAGLAPTQVSDAIDRLKNNLGDRTFGINLIHSPAESALEDVIVDLLIEKEVRLIEASAFIALTLPLIRYRVQGIHRNEAGQIVTPNRVIGKVSRVEVATRFLSPPPEKMLAKLVEQGVITAEQAELAAQIPVAQDVSAEADSGGHTDNRPALALLPTLMALRDRIQSEQNYQAIPLRIGIGGGIATPASAAAAFSMGAAYILTGSVNQACVESGSSDIVRKMLADAHQADTQMAAAGDMFEMGVKVQVLKRGTMFAMRANKLYDLYRAYDSIDALPTSERVVLEKNLFRAPLTQIWEETKAYFEQRNPKQIQKAESDPKYRMALVFRWYLGHSSRWANQGEPSRKIDYQIWCGPAMGAFNEWVRGTFLEKASNRKAVTVAYNILYGTAILMRSNSLRLQGYPLSKEMVQTVPLEADRLRQLLKIKGPEN